jgi:hypothetical protein
MKGIAALALAVCFVVAVCVLASPTPAAQRGYTFHNVDALVEELLPVVKARHGCPASWDGSRSMDECREAAAHKDFDAYDRAGKAARRLWP